MGFGERKTNGAFIAACDKFVYFHVLSMPPPPSSSSSSSSSSAPSYLTVHRSGPRPIDGAALDALRRAIVASVDEGDNCADLANVGHYLRRISPDLNARNYGYGRLKDFVEASGIVDVRLKTFDGGRTPVALVRLKDQKHVKRTFDQLD